jgi:preprotein translocase subunit YajC
MNFLMSDTAMAQAQGAAQQPGLMDMLIMPMGFLLILYFFMIRPQAKKARDHQTLLSTLKAGDEVVTTGGIIGRVKSVAETFVSLEIGGGSSIKVLKSNVSTLSPATAPVAKKTVSAK